MKFCFVAQNASATEILVAKSAKSIKIAVWFTESCIAHNQWCAVRLADARRDPDLRVTACRFFAGPHVSVSRLGGEPD